MDLTEQSCAGSGCSVLAIPAPVCWLDVVTHSVYSASRSIPSPSFNTETPEPAKAPTISPLRQSQDFDDTYCSVGESRLFQGLSDYRGVKSFMK